MLELRNIEKYYNPGTINEMCLFDKFNLTVDKGEFVSVVGSNGSGKTSMLNILCGSIPVDGGQILMNGEDITTKKEFKRNQKIGRVYQNPAMGTCPTMTILENMSLADNKGVSFFSSTIFPVNFIISSAVFGSKAAVCSSRIRKSIGVIVDIRRAIA